MFHRTFDPSRECVAVPGAICRSRVALLVLWKVESLQTLGDVAVPGLRM
jgi:hypothetical protein